MGSIGINWDQSPDCWSTKPGTIGEMFCSLSRASETSDWTVSSPWAWPLSPLIAAARAGVVFGLETTVTEMASSPLFSPETAGDVGGAGGAGGVRVCRRPFCAPTSLGMDGEVRCARVQAQEPALKLTCGSGGRYGRQGQRQWKPCPFESCQAWIRGRRGGGRRRHRPPRLRSALPGT
eukprot:SAG31_NODE_815_length_11876_cov_2.189182_3_plen_178_part_00